MKIMNTESPLSTLYLPTPLSDSLYHYSPISPHYTIFQNITCKDITCFQDINFILINFLIMLPESFKTMNRNHLKTKIKPFKDKLTQSLSRNNQKTSMQNLASSVYSVKKNSSFVIQRSKSKVDINPQHQLITNALKGLDLRASQISNLSEHNTQFLLEKKDLEDKILHLKEEIAKETRIKNRSETNWKTHENHNNYANQAFQELCKKSVKLNQNINQTRQENNQLNKEIYQLKQNNKEKVNNINIQSQNVQNLAIEVNNLKNTLMSEQKQRNYLKDQLIKEQRFMDSLSIETKQLQNQRAMVLLNINSSVVKNKL